MADIRMAAEIAAEQARREEEERERERERRRAEIQDRIRGCNDRIAGVNSLISDLAAGKSGLNASLEDWGIQKRKYNGSDILSEVVLVNVFEGVCAERIRNEFSSCMAQMDRTCVGVSRMVEDVNAQIARLLQYITMINTELTTLRNELSSI